MRLGFDRGAVPGGLHRVGICADIAERRMIDPVGELRRTLRQGRFSDHCGADQANCRYREPCQWVRARIHVALLEYFPLTDASGTAACNKDRPTQTLHGINCPLTQGTSPASPVQTKYRPIQMFSSERTRSALA